MNDGANVFDNGVPVFEFERFRMSLLLGEVRLDNDAKDWFRLCMGIGLCDAESGEDIIIDLGLPPELPGTGAGAGDAEFVLAKGLLRFCAALDAILKYSIQSTQDGTQICLCGREEYQSI